MKRVTKDPDGLKEFRSIVKCMGRAYGNAPRKGREQAKAWIDEVAEGREPEPPRLINLEGEILEVKSPSLQFHWLFKRKQINPRNPVVRRRLDAIIDKAIPDHPMVSE